MIELALEYQRHKASSLLVSDRLRNWASASAIVSRKQYLFGDVSRDLSVSPVGNSLDTYTVSDEAAEQRVEVELHRLVGNSAELTVNGIVQTATFMSPKPGQLYCSIAGRGTMFKDKIILDGAVDEAVGGGRVAAPMHGLLLDVLVRPGDQVTKGQNLAVLEAMKMHYEIVAQIDGIVQEVTAVAGNQVAADDVLIEITEQIKEA